MASVPVEWDYLLGCDQEWDATGACPGDLVIIPMPQAWGAFSYDSLDLETMSLMFGAGFGGVGMVLVVALASGVLLRFIRGD